MAIGRGEARRTEGFTLVELLIVLTLVGLMSAAVVIVMPDPRGSLTGEAERFAARAQAAQNKAAIDGRAISIRITSAGYGFDRRDKAEWRTLAQKPFVDHAWSAGVQAAFGAEEMKRIVFDPIGVAEPARLVLQRDGDQVAVEIAHDGKINVVG